MNNLNDSISVAFRCDASTYIGSGHLIRCRNLARALRKKGINSVFICRKSSNSIHSSILSGEFLTVDLPIKSDPMTVIENNIGNLSHKNKENINWLGCTEEEDYSDFYGVICRKNFESLKLIIVDHYGISSIWHAKLREKFSLIKLLVIDDLFDRSLDADFVLNSNIIPSRLEFKNNTKYLIGPAFSPLSNEYSFLQPLIVFRKEVSTLLISFGSIDSLNFSLVCIKALQNPLFENLNVDIVLGNSAPHISEIKEAILNKPNIHLHIGLPSLAGLMTKADLAIGSGGSTSWERTSLGLPSIVIPLAENQSELTKSLSKAGVAVVLNLLDSNEPSKEIENALINLIKNPNEIYQMSKKCTLLGDGRGLNRIIGTVFGPSCKVILRQATKNDEWIYFWWVNDPEVRRQSFENDDILINDHLQWFNKKLESDRTLLFVLEDLDGFPLGQIRFERQNFDTKKVKVSFSLDHIARGKGLSSSLLELGCNQTLNFWGHNIDIFGEVKKENLASCKAFIKSGFEEIQFSDPQVRCFLKNEFNTTN